MADRPRVAVVGGGITGLATAHHLRHAADVVLLEAGDRLGGKIHSAEIGGMRVDTGPDSFLARVPTAVALCRELGLGDQLVAPATGEAYVWTRGRLRPLPTGLVLGVPSQWLPLARSGVVSPRGAARAALDLVLPRTARTRDDPSVADVVGRRLGGEVLERLVDPLLGGIHAGRCHDLSLAANAPQVADASSGHRSLMRGLRAQRRVAVSPTVESAPAPVFLSLRGGLVALVERLAAVLDECDGCEVRTGHVVTSIERRPGGGFVLQPYGGTADAVVLTVPAFAAAALVRSLSETAGHDLAQIRHATVATVTLAYPRWAIPPLRGSGFLVPRVDGRTITACTWLTAKWPHLGRPDVVLLRASVGRFGDDAAVGLDDDTLGDRVHADLVEAMGLRGSPGEVVVSRWVDAFPQYEVGHLARLGRIDAALARVPGLLLAGAPYRGVGIAACVQQAKQAAARALQACSRRT